MDTVSQIVFIGTVQKKKKRLPGIGASLKFCLKISLLEIENIFLLKKYFLKSF